MRKKSVCAKYIKPILFCVLLTAATVAALLLFGTDRYYIACAVIAVGASVPFFVSFERKKNSARETAVIASLTAAAVVSRAAFYFLPQIKPIAAVVIIGAVSFGGEVGFLTGSLSMLLSDFIFGVGAWTPFQMLGLGLVGFIMGKAFYNSKLRYNRFALGLVGGLLTFFVYGFLVDTSSVLFFSSDYSKSSVLAVYASGAPFNLIFGAATAVILILFGKFFIERTERLRTKYGVFERSN